MRRPEPFEKNYAYIDMRFQGGRALSALGIRSALGGLSGESNLLGQCSGMTPERPLPSDLELRDTRPVWKLIPVVLAAIAVAVWFAPWRWYALGWAVPLSLVLLFSAAIWIRKRRHPAVDEMDEQTEILQDLREAAAWLFGFLP